MKSIVEMNTLPHNRLMGWQTRLNEVQAADGARARELARHHFLIAQRYCIDAIRSALEDQSEFAKMPKADLKLVGVRRLGNATESAFRAFRVMDRLEPAIAAVQKIAGEKLAPDLEDVRRQIWQVLENVDSIRQRFYATPRGAGRQSVDLSGELGPLCDELHNHIVTFYRIAKAKYGLPEMIIDGRTVN